MENIFNLFLPFIKFDKNNILFLYDHYVANEYYMHQNLYQKFFNTMNNKDNLIIIYADYDDIILIIGEYYRFIDNNINKKQIELEKRLRIKIIKIFSFMSIGNEKKTHIYDECKSLYKCCKYMIKHKYLPFNFDHEDLIMFLYHDCKPFVNFLRLSKHNIIKIYDEKIFGIELINDIKMEDIFITIFIKTYNKFVINEAKFR